MENLILMFFAIGIILAIVFGIRLLKNSSSAHKKLKAQLQSKYNLKNGKLFSLTDSKDRQIWFSIQDRDYVSGLETYGQDTIANPSYCGVSVIKQIKDSYDFDFMLLNQNKPTSRISFKPFKPLTSNKLSSITTEKFHIITSQNISDDQIEKLNELAESLAKILHIKTRYEAAYKNDRLSVYIGVNSFNTFNELDQCYQLAMQCMDELESY